MDVVSLLGHLNKYVEHNKSKVIFIANQKELLKLNLSANKEQKVLAAMNTPEYIDFIDKYKSEEKREDTHISKEYTNKMSKALDNSLTNLFVNEDLFNLAKEKVIGKTLKFEMNFNDILEEIIKPILDTKDELEFINEESIAYINQIADNKNHYNIRTIKRILENCSYYFNKIEKATMENSEFNAIKNDKKYKNEIFKQFVICTIKYKKNVAKYDKLVLGATYQDIKEDFNVYRYKVFESVKEMVKSSSFKEELVKKEYNTYLEYSKFIRNNEDKLNIYSEYSEWQYLT